MLKKNSNKCIKCASAFIVLLVLQSCSKSLTKFPIYDANPSNMVDSVDIKAIQSFYSELHGNEWDMNTNWNSDNPVYQWVGIGVVNGRINLINLGGNNLKGNIPFSIGYLTQLKELDLSANIIKGSIPEQIANNTSLEKLYLQGNSITQIPPNIGNLNNLKIFNMMGNLLQELPTTMAKMSSLEELYLNFNAILNINPETFTEGSFPNLKVLDISDNAIQHLPPTIGNIQSLEKLNISSNYLSVLPSKFYTLYNLSELQMNYCGLTDIDPNIKNLKKLKILGLALNQIDSIPPAIAELSDLENLDLSSNCIDAKKISPQIGLLKNSLQILNFRGNNHSFSDEDKDLINSYFEGGITKIYY